jgi:hypothetical protein
LHQLGSLTLGRLKAKFKGFHLATKMPLEMWIQHISKGNCNLAQHTC